MQEARFRGELVKWNDERGFGFISPSVNEADQIFLHIKDIRRSVRRPMPGDKLSFSLRRQPDGKMRAVNAEIDGATMPERASPTPRWIPWAATLCFGCSVIVALGTELIWIMLAYPAMSVVSTLSYMNDKSAAQKGGWRVAERELLAIDALGGWPGSALAQQLLRHKVSKESFQTAYRRIVAGHVVLWVVIVALLLLRPPLVEQIIPRSF